MASIRQLFQTNDPAHLPVLRDVSAQLRRQPGCLQAEDFRSLEVETHVAHLELWESPAAWDAAWATLRGSDLGTKLAAIWRSAEAPFQLGHPVTPRDHGQNGLELYRQAIFDFADGGWRSSDAAERPETIRWPAWSAVRIIISTTADPDGDIAPRLNGIVAARSETGCRQFEHFRSLDEAWNIAVVELWDSPQIFDLHWMNRLLARRAAGGEPYSQATFAASRFEFYNACRYALAGDVLAPEPPHLRMATLAY